MGVTSQAAMEIPQSFGAKSKLGEKETILCIWFPKVILELKRSEAASSGAIIVIIDKVSGLFCLDYTLTCLVSEHCKK